VVQKHPWNRPGKKEKGSETPAGNKNAKPPEKKNWQTSGHRPQKDSARPIYATEGEKKIERMSAMGEVQKKPTEKNFVVP